MDIPLRQYWDLLARHVRPQRLRFSLLTALLLGGIGLQILNPQLLRYFIDAATSGQAVETLALASLAFIAIALLQQIVAVGATYVGENVAWTATNALRAELHHHCLQLDMTFHNTHSPGELIERIDGDVAELSSFFSRLVIRVIGNLLLLCGVLSVLYLEDWRLGLGFTLFASIMLCALNRVRSIAVPHRKAFRAATADLFSFLEERLSGIEDLRSSGAVDFVLRRLYQLQYAIMGYDRQSWLAGLIVGLTARMSMVLATALAFVAGYTLYHSGAMTIGTVYLVVHYINLLGWPIRELTYQVENLQKIGASVTRLDELRQLQSTIQDGPGADLPAGPLSLAFEGVSFAYVDAEPVFKDLSFQLEPGAVLGLLGRTGSGKTTLARLACRLYDPTAGRIALGGVDLRRAKLGLLRQRVALVTQDVQLFQATVRDNLAFFDHSIPDARIIQVIEELGLVDWYRSLPRGLDTRLAAGGRALSAGEAQLLAFARVFLREPGLVVLDEASSRLDPATEARIDLVIDRLLQDRTAIVIAHRLSTVQRADQVMILERGRVIERGTRERLARDPTSHFHHLLQTGLEQTHPYHTQVPPNARQEQLENLRVLCETTCTASAARCK
jgi:ATP-binding cassette subfamily B protein